MRYAENLADGTGLVFNPGERVEGFSNPLWTLALALGSKTGADLPLFARLLSLLFGVLLVSASISLFERVCALAGGDPGAAVIAFAILSAASMPLVFFSTSALETTAAAYFVVAGVLGHLRAEAEASYRWHVLSNGAFLIAALLRPEGAVFLVVNAGAVLVRHRLRPPNPAVWSLVVVLGLFVLAVAWRSAYFGSPVPNTYFAKPGAGAGYWSPLVTGWRTLAHYFMASGILLLAPIGVFALGSRRGRTTALYIATICCAQLAFIVFVGGDVLRFDRFTVVVHPLLLSLVLIGALRLSASPSRSIHAVTTGSLTLAVVIVVGLNAERVRRALNKPCYHDFMHAQVHRAIGGAFAKMFESHSVLVANEVGAIPYFSRLRTIDMIGLTDEAVAEIIYESYQRFGTTDTTWCGDRIADYAMARHPTVVLLPALADLVKRPGASGDVMHGIWEGIHRHPLLAPPEYRCAFVIGIGTEKFLHGFVSTDVTLDTAPLDRLDGLRCVSVAIYQKGKMLSRPVARYVVAFLIAMSLFVR